MTVLTGRRFVTLIVLLFFLSVINYLDRSVLAVSADGIMKEFHLSPAGFGLLSSVFLWSYTLFLIPSGLIADKIGPKRMVGAGVAIWSCATLLASLVTSVGALFGARLFLGLGETVTGPNSNKMIRARVPAERRALASAVFNSGGYAGPAFGAALLSAVVAMAGWRWAFVVAGAIGLLWIIPWLLWFRKDHAAPVPSETANFARVDDTGQPLGLQGLLRQPSMWGLALAQGCAVYSQYLFLTWLPSYLQQSRGLNVENAGLLTAVPYIGAVVLGILIGTLSDRLLTADDARKGKRRMWIGAMMLVSACVLFVPFAHSMVTVTILLTICLTGVSSSITFCFALLNDLLGTSKDAARASSIAFVGGNLFGLAAPIVTGFVVTASGSYTPAFVTAAVVLGVGVLISQLATRRRIEPRDRATIRIREGAAQ